MALTLAMGAVASGCTDSRRFMGPCTADFRLGMGIVVITDAGVKKAGCVAPRDRPSSSLHHAGCWFAGREHGQMPSAPTLRLLVCSPSPTNSYARHV